MTLTAAALLGTAIPAALMSIFLFGCCALPFHRYVHRIMPLCGGFLRALGHEPHPDATPAKAPPARKVGKAVAPLAPPAMSGVPSAGRYVAPGRTSFRSFMTLGALRCDDDVGLHLLFAHLLI